MPWEKERLSPEPDGTNTHFAVTKTPIRGSLVVVLGGPGTPLGPSLILFGPRYRAIGKQIELGVVPQVDQHPWARYFTEET